MPYIPSEDRPLFTNSLDDLVKRINNKAELCYCIYYLIVSYGLSGKANWNQRSDAECAANAAANEFRRRHIDPYEDTKIKSNGDITGFPQK